MLILPPATSLVFRWCKVLSVAVCAVVTALATPCVAQTPHLAQYVPADAGLYLELNDLPAALQSYYEGPLYDRLDECPAWIEWKQAEWSNVEALREGVAAGLGLSWDILNRDILSGQIAVAVWPNSPSFVEAGPQPGNTLVLLRANNPNSLQLLCSGFRGLQQAMGIEWTVDKIEDIDVHVGTDLATSQVKFALAIVNETAILADSKNTCLAALALRRDAAEESSLAELDSFQQAIAALPSESDGIAFMNPVPWQKVLAEQLSRAQLEGDAQARSEQTLQSWRALSYSAFGLTVGEDIQLAGVVKFDEEKLPAELKAFLNSAAGESALMQAIPSNCLAAVAIHLDITQLPGWFVEQPGASPILRQIATSLGPDFGAHLTAVGSPSWLQDDAAGHAAGNAVQDITADRRGDGPFPLAWVFEMSVRPTFDIQDLPNNFNDMLREAMPEIINLAYRTTGSSWFANLNTLVDQGAQLSTVQEWTLFAAGESTSFGIKDTYVLASSSSEAVVEFRNQTDIPSLADDKTIAPKLAHPILGGAPNQVVFLNSRSLRELLAQRSAQIAAAIEAAQPVTPEEAKIAVSQMIEVLSLADYVSATARVTKNRVAFSLQISADQ